MTKRLGWLTMRCGVGWKFAVVLWVSAGIVTLGAPAAAVPISIDGINLSWGQLLTLLGIAMAWGDMRRAHADTRQDVKDIRDDLRRLPCRTGKPCKED